MKEAVKKRCLTCKIRIPLHNEGQKKPPEQPQSDACEQETESKKLLQKLVSDKL